MDLYRLMLLGYFRVFEPPQRERIENKYGVCVCVSQETVGIKTIMSENMHNLRERKKNSHDTLTFMHVSEDIIIVLRLTIRLYYDTRCWNCIKASVAVMS